MSEGAKLRHQLAEPHEAPAATSSDQPAAPRVKGPQPPQAPRPPEPPKQPRGPGLLTQIFNLVCELISAVWNAVLGSAPVQKIWRLSSVQYVYSFIALTYSALFQRLGMLDLPAVDFVGSPTKGLTAIVTGCTSGIGFETAAALARRGTRVVMACRDVQRAAELKERLRQDAQRMGYDDPDIEVWRLDLASLKSVREFATKWEQQQRELHILINNAGIFSLGAPRRETEDGFESHIGTNHLGHFLLTLMLIPSLRRGAEAQPAFGSRVVLVASMSHLMASSGMRTSDPHFRRARPFIATHAQAHSKLAIVLFMKELRRRLGPESPLQVFAVDPGIALTNIGHTHPRLLQFVYRNIFGPILLKPHESCRASIYAATSAKAPLEAWDSFGYIEANCRPAATSPAGQDMVQARWVWRWSAEQVQLPAHLDIPDS